MPARAANQAQVEMQRGSPDGFIRPSPEAPHLASAAVEKQSTTAAHRDGRVPDLHQPSPRFTPIKFESEALNGAERGLAPRLAAPTPTPGPTSIRIGTITLEVRPPATTAPTPAPPAPAPASTQAPQPFSLRRHHLRWS
ncbi:MAG: hypothetical protein EOP38_10875 [Rubrivivax sp.]|nr:MAG: hypothetical protein EOP38_10875 [Rubrivivax sp.]